MSNEAIIATLTKLAKANPTRGAFNRAVADKFIKIGAGCFRMVFDAGDVVIKVRRATPIRENPFPMEKIDKSNRDEAKAYASLIKCQPTLATFVLPSTLVKLPNGHDAIIMEKVDAVWENMDQDDVTSNNHFLHNQIQVIQMAFQDGHDANVGVKGNRAFLIDLNFYDRWNLDSEELAFIRKVANGVKAALEKSAPLLMEAAA
jgi:translation elongation factor EF-G